MLDVKPETEQEVWKWAADLMYGDGPSTRSQYKIVPLLHILSDLGGDPVMWCSGGPALAEGSQIQVRRCPKCLTLAREMLEDLWEDET